MKPVENPFTDKEEAARYQTYRPRYHHLPFSSLKEHSGRTFENSLDVACGTGHSSFALSQISKNVVGCDLSEAMLTEARKDFGNINFVQAPAEKLPFENQSFDLVSVSMGFHWFEQNAFLKEAKRILKQNGLLAIDNHGFLNQVSEDAGNQQLYRDFFKEFLPPASRREAYPTEEMVKFHNMNLVKEIKFDHKFAFDAEAFKNFLMTMSNFQVLSDDKKQKAMEKMTDIFKIIFENQKHDLKFAGKMLVYQFS